MRILVARLATLAFFGSGPVFCKARSSLLIASSKVLFVAGDHLLNVVALIAQKFEIEVFHCDIKNLFEV